MGGRRLFAGEAIVVFASRRSEGPSRVGITTSRQLRRSVDRSRAKRRLREVARLVFLGDDSALQKSGIPYDVVLIARPAALGAPFESLRGEAARSLDLLARR